jgi:hypothetical protein
MLIGRGGSARRRFTASGVVAATFLPKMAAEAQWLTMDEAIIDRCDLMVLLPGESAGAEREVAYAESIGLPILTLEQAIQQQAIAA